MPCMVVAGSSTVSLHDSIAEQADQGVRYCRLVLAGFAKLCKMVCRS